MTRPIDLLRQGRRRELWQMCCGFIDLSLEQFMGIQKRLLLEQIELLKSCELGRKVMRGAMPETVEEFREQVPLTTYSDYLPELVEKREEVLPTRVARWVRTSGHSGEYDVKWVPMSEDFLSEYQKAVVAFGIFGMCKRRHDTSQVKEHLKVLYMVGPPEYASGLCFDLAQQAVNYDLLPSNVDGIASFQETVQAGFAEALHRGLDGFGGLSSVLVAVGEQLRQRSRSTGIRSVLSHPNALLRVTGAVVKSKLGRRSMLPKDLWSVKVILGGGADSTVFGKRVNELWGRRPLEVYGGTEGGLYAVQTWDYEGMSFYPSLNFFEFIPEREWFKWRLDRSYQLKTILLDEVRAGETYELVITNLHGGVLTRYRVGDMIKITSLRNEKLNIGIPQMVFHRRADELIDITGFGHLTERIIWEAIEQTGIPYADWTARKEVVDDKPLLHIYLELKDNTMVAEQGVAAAIFEELTELDKVYHYNIYSAYGNPETVLGSKPVKVTFLGHGAFSNYIAQRQAEGAALGHLKPPHVNPSDGVLSSLGAREVVVKAVPVSGRERVEA
ncbi:MAG: GH3 auxin-responsive promoter family protein [Dehalococcoidia bacterium]|nr:GH3 auxin-responsive promoter family protein [Dehalococcoidia bacterium]